MLVKNFENIKCKATEENLDKLLSITENIDVNIKNALIYDAYFYTKEGKILWGPKKCLNPEFWDSLDAIHLVNGQFHYTEETVIKEKPKNNFEDYGFEADFEGEILKEVDDYYIGWANIFEYGLESCKWSKSGDTNYYVYNLKPIKKEWYENLDNFPCLVYHIYDNSFHIATDATIDEGGRLIKVNNKYRPSDVFRPATKEEVLSLLVKEE